MPSPLHPAVVHFPVVLLILGAFVSVLAVFFRRWSLPVAAAVLLGLGALGSFAAIVTGEQDEERAEVVAPEALLEQHEDAASQTRLAAIVATFFACVSVALARWPIMARTAGAAAAVVAVSATLLVARTGNLGGRLVYDYGAGIHAVTAASKAPASRAHDDD